MYVLAVNGKGFKVFQCIAAPEGGLELRRPASTDVAKKVVAEFNHTLDRIVAGKERPVDPSKIRTPAPFIQSRVGYVPVCVQSGGSRHRGAGRGWN